MKDVTHGSKNPYGYQNVDNLIEPHINMPTRQPNSKYSNDITNLNL